MLLGATDEAIKHFEEAVKYVEPQFGSYIAHDLAEAYEAVGRIDDAIAMMTLAHDSHTDASSKMFLKDRLEHLKRLKSQVLP